MSHYRHAVTMLRPFSGRDAHIAEILLSDWGAARGLQSIGQAQETWDYGRAGYCVTFRGEPRKADWPTALRAEPRSADLTLRGCEEMVAFDVFVELERALTVAATEALLALRERQEVAA